MLLSGKDIHKTILQASNFRKTGKDLVICTDMPSNEFLHRHPNCYYVLFNEDLVFDHRIENTWHHPYSAYISESDYKETRDEANRIWHKFTASTSDRSIYFYRYVYYNHLVPILFVKGVLQKLLRLSFERVYLSESFKNASDISLNLWQPDTYNEKFIEWSIYPLVKEILAASRQKPFHYSVGDNNSHFQNRKRQLIWRSLINAVETSINLASMLIDVTFKPSLFNNCYDAGTKSKRVLIIAQTRKSAHLISNLRSQKISYQRLTVGAFYKLALGNSEIKSNPQYYINSPNNRPLDCLNEWINSSHDLHLQALPAALSKILDNYANVIITDNETDPILYYLNSSISVSTSNHIVVIPEGAMSNYHQNTEDVFMLFNHKRMLRCFIGSDEKEQSKLALSPHLMSSNLCETYVCGYNTSLKYSRALGRIIKAFLNLFGALRGKIIIYYNVPYLEKDSFLPRIYKLPKYQKYRHIIELLSSLPSSQFLFISSIRGAEPAVHLPQFKKICFSNLHWSILASIADLSIVSDSSIGPEIMLNGKPVLKWLPSPMITNDIFAYLDVLPSSVYRKVTNYSELLEAIEKMAVPLTTNLKCQDAIQEYIQQPRYHDLTRRIRTLVDSI